MRTILVLTALSLAACAPAVRTAPADAPAQPPADTTRRFNLRPVPTSEAFRRGLAAGTRTETRSSVTPPVFGARRFRGTLSE